MAKKKGSRRSRQGDEEFDDSASSVSTSTVASLRDFDVTEATVLDTNPFERCIDALYEKRASVREKGLEGLVALLTGNYCFDEVQQRQETLTSICLGCLRRGSTTEAVTAARGLGLHAITLGASDETERLAQEARPVLETASLHSKAAGVRVAAAETLALLTFVAAEDPQATEEVMNHLSGLRRAPSFKVVAAALRGWALLLSTLPAWRLDSAKIEAHLASLASHLHDDDVEVRGAAGEAIALLYHSTGLQELRPFDNELSSNPETPSTPESGDEAEMSGDEAGTSSAFQADMDDVMARMKDLATNRGDRQRRSKRDRSSLKTTFRDLHNIVEDGAVAETKIKLRHGDTLVVDTLAATVQLNALRRYLAEGFQIHLQENPLLHQIFGFEPREQRAERLTPLEKRMYRSPASVQSKSRTLRRNYDRAASAAYKGAMIGGDL
ncbi:hypothetical protein WJX72_005686 [[Myrmecia] bisecta]|uniref:Interferon-related developmental regulator 1 n=1 Tax=[Myrmecia] bisecta TaxID=41462 RepID=A0AAW1QQT9_9CHLO